MNPEILNELIGALAYWGALIFVCSLGMAGVRAYYRIGDWWRKL